LKTFTNVDAVVHKLSSHSEVFMKLPTTVLRADVCYFACNVCFINTLKVIIDVLQRMAPTALCKYQ